MKTMNADARPIGPRQTLTPSLFARLSRAEAGRARRVAYEAVLAVIG